MNIIRVVLRLMLDAGGERRLRGVQESPAHEDQAPEKAETTLLAQRLRGRPTGPGAGGAASSRVVEPREFQSSEQVRGRDDHRGPGDRHHERGEARTHGRSPSENASVDPPAAIGIRTPRAHFQLWTRNEKLFVRTTAVAPELPEAVGEALKAIDSLERVARMQSTDVRITGLVRGARDAIRAVGERYREEQRAAAGTGPIRKEK